MHGSFVDEHLCDWLPIKHESTQPNSRKRVPVIEDSDPTFLNDEFFEKYDLPPQNSRRVKAFIRGIGESHSKTFIESMLDVMPSSYERILDFEVVNSSAASEQDMGREVRTLVAKAAVETEQESLHNFKMAESCRLSYTEMMKASREDASTIVDEAYLNLLEAASQKTKDFQRKSIDSLCKLIAFRRIQNFLFINGMAKVPKSRDNFFEFLPTLATNSDVRKLVSRIVAENVTKILADSRHFVDEKGSPRFYFKAKDNKVSFLSATVRYSPIMRPRKIFVEHFLSIQDKVVKATLRDSKRSEDIITADVLIYLGTDKLPPSYEIADRYRAFKQHSLENSSFRELKDSIQLLLDNNEKGTLASELTAEQIANLTRGVKHWQNKIDHEQKEIAKLSRFPLKRPIHGYFHMTVEINYPQEHCQVCLTTSHTQQVCKQRSCEICYSQAHYTKNCSLKCRSKKCKRSTLHEYGDCY